MPEFVITEGTLWHGKWALCNAQSLSDKSLNVTEATDEDHGARCIEEYAGRCESSVLLTLKSGQFRSQIFVHPDPGRRVDAMPRKPFPNQQFRHSFAAGGERVRQWTRSAER
ncbi:hypothetical protein GGR33_005188 [Methylobacterium brachythecii]|uniref:Uncharacterized protein n=1 Tax=Methylobacterium brachythecii TaxID=1176177 RepID=A0A7W6FA03_9HYPH|nr:hypothetical protein [Methylobacterium brachythecii]